MLDHLQLEGLSTLLCITESLCLTALNICLDDEQGASEIVLKRCVAVMDPKGNPIQMTDALAAQLGDDVTDMASRGYRTLALAFRDFSPEASSDSSQFEFPPEEQLTLQCILGIKACSPAPPSVGKWIQKLCICFCDCSISF